MYSAQYSPFGQSSQHQTGNRQTTSYKKYPANKYDDPIDIKHQLFQGKYSYHAQQSRDQEPVFFKNSRVNESLYGNQPDSVIQTSRYMANRKHDKIDDYSELMSHYEKGQNPPKTKHKKSSNKNKKLKSKSCQLSLKQVKRTIPSKQEHQELQMYKKLCVTLRKQNQDFQSKICKQQKHESKFSSEVQQLKQKIKKMYDHCIEKNKSTQNVDIDLKHLINKHTGKENNLTRTNKGKESSFEAKKLCKSYQVKDEKVRHNSKVTNGDRCGYKQTIDTAGTSKRDLNIQSFREDNNNFKKKTSKSIKFIQTQLKQSSTSYHPTQTESLKPPTKFPQYDQQQSEIEQNPQTKNNPDSQSQYKYKQFFETFTKSLQIFQTNTSPSQKLKAKHLKQAGYEVQWAKQQWLEIVEYLIQKGYASRNEVRRTKRAETTVRSVR